MKIWKKYGRLFLTMLLFWFLLTLQFDFWNVIGGIVVSLFVSITTKTLLHTERLVMFEHLRIHKVILYILVLFLEIFRSAFVYAYNLLTHQYRPIAFEMELEFNDPVKVGIVANSITLTPGTITVETVDNRITVITLAKPGTSQAELEKPIRDKFERFLK